jgi:exodeoxyribonuclease (lambda-induced)
MSTGPTIAQMFGLPADWHVSMAPQGTVEWLEARRGCITGSMAKVARDKLKSGEPTKAAITYARDCARERAGAGSGDPVFETAAMRFGSEQEAYARRAYEARTGYMVDAAGFVCTPDRKFGVSVDGLVYDEPGQRGGVEIKTIVGSNPLFEAVVGGDISAYIDQCDMNTWAWVLDWIDLILWAPDLPSEAARLTVIRLHRNQDRIDALLADLVVFDRVVDGYAAQLRTFIAGPADPTPADAPPKPAAAPAPAPAAAKPVELTDADF